MESGPAAASGCNSVVECLLPKQDVEGSNPFARSSLSSFFFCALAIARIDASIRGGGVAG